MKSLALLSIVLFFIATSFAQKGIHESFIPTAPIVIDGDPAEWNTEWMLDPDGKFLFNVGNDDENIYLRLKVSDDLTQQKIGLFGLYVKLDANGKKKGKMGLKYPMGKDASELKKDQPPFRQDAAGRTYAKKQLLNDVEVLELLGLAKENIVSSRLGLMNGIQILIVADEEGAYVYEAKIPFKAFKIDKTKTPILGITFETGKMSMAKSAPAAPNTGQAPGQGGFGQRSLAGSYNELMVPGYMWVGVRLK